MILDIIFLLLSLSVVLILCITMIENKTVKTRISWSIATGVSALTAIILSLQASTLMDSRYILSALGNWLKIDSIQIDISYFIDPWSITVAILSSWLTFLIIVFSWTYIGKSKHTPLYYSLVIFFLFGMLLLLFSDNIVLLFFGWEIVGICSWALISYYYYKDDIRDLVVQSGMKALITTGFADLGLLYSIYSLLRNDLPLDISLLLETQSLPNGFYYGVILAAIGKSAQFPLHIWIASTDSRNIDAMQGPTTVSALIHAATMVNAGIYLISRIVIMGVTVDISRTFVYIGTFTTVFAALSALGTFDMKRILAFSTISQLGYMVASLGLQEHASFISLWHLVNHAFFKGLLFLSVGAILSQYHNRDIREVSFDLRSNKLVFSSLCVGLFSLVGIPPFSGFFSKDLIVEEMLQTNSVAAYFLYLGMLLTSAYSFRMMKYMLSPVEKTDKLVLSVTNTFVLLILVLISLISSLVYFPLSGWFATFGYTYTKHFYHLNVIYLIVSLLLIIIGAFLGWNSKVIAGFLPGFILKMAENGYYIDSIIANLPNKILEKISSLVTKIQTGDHFWNIFLFIFSATGITSYLYYLQTGGIF